MPHSTVYCSSERVYFPMSDTSCPSEVVFWGTNEKECKLPGGKDRDGVLPQHVHSDEGSGADYQEET